jgi:adenylate cyclase
VTERPSFFAELKRRNVIRAAVLYGGAAWALAQGIAQLTPVVNAPEWAARWFLVAACIGFPFWLAFAWFYEWTPEGFKREHEVEAHESITHHTGRKLDFAIIGVLAVAVVLLLTDRFVLRHGVNQEVAVSEHSIAVLPFVNMSADKEQEYFADGISEELLNLLAQVPELRVIARTSSFSFKGEDVDITDIARKLNVANVLEGSVRKSGDKLRITAQLVRASDSSHLWSQTYDRQMTDVFQVQDEIAAAVVEQLKVKLLDEAPKTRALDPKTYELFLKARAIGNQYTAAAFEQSVSLYQQALARDPGYVESWVRLAGIYCDQVNEKLRPADEGIQLAREATDRALTLDPQYAPAHARLGWIAIVYDRDFQQAADHLTHALTLEPANSDVIGIAAILSRRLGRWNQAIAFGEYLLSRDPVNADALSQLGLAYTYSGRWNEALATYRTMIALQPAAIGNHALMSEALMAKGDAEAALAEAQQETDVGWRLMLISIASYALGQAAESDAALAELVKGYEQSYQFHIATVLAFRGDADHAFEWMEKAAEQHDPDLGSIIAHRLFDKLHDDPRWLAFLLEHGMAPEQLAAIKFDVKMPQ